MAGLKQAVEAISNEFAIAELELIDRRNRWGYYGLHGLDFSFLYNNRPLWDILMLSLVSGVVMLSVTTLVPAWRRLKKHFQKMTRSGKVWQAPGTTEHQ